MNVYEVHRIRQRIAHSVDALKLDIAKLRADPEAATKWRDEINTLQMAVDSARLANISFIRHLTEKAYGFAEEPRDPE